MGAKKFADPGGRAGAMGGAEGAQLGMVRVDAANDYLRSKTVIKTPC